MIVSPMMGCMVGLYVSLYLAVATEQSHSILPVTESAVAVIHISVEDCLCIVLGIDYRLGYPCAVHVHKAILSCCYFAEADVGEELCHVRCAEFIELRRSSKVKRLILMVQR